VNRKVGLGPAAFFAELAYALPKSHTDIFGCHALSMAVFFGLHFAYRIQSGSRVLLGNRSRVARRAGSRYSPTELYCFFQWAKVFGKIELAFCRSISCGANTEWR